MMTVTIIMSAIAIAPFGSNSSVGFFSLILASKNRIMVLSIWLIVRRFLYFYYAPPDLLASPQMQFYIVETRLSAISVLLIRFPFQLSKPKKTIKFLRHRGFYGKFVFCCEANPRFSLFLTCSINDQERR